jgi:ATP-dependent Clp protease ATP-binding subunit ClpC
MFERFTERARRVVVLAQEEARLLNHNYIGTEHILLGLIHEQNGVAARVLTAAGVTIEAARAQVESMIGRGNQAPSGHIPFTPRAKKVLELSLREALDERRSYIGTEHILLGLLREGHGVGAQILERLAGSASALREQVLEAAAGPAEEGEFSETELDMWARMASGRGRPGSAFGPSGEPFIGVNLRTVRDFSALLASIDRRLANVERHLGIASEPEAGPEAGPGPEAEAGSEPAAE